MTHLVNPWPRAVIVGIVLASTASCASLPGTGNPSSGGGLLGPPPPIGWNNSPAPTGQKLIEVRGYVLARKDQVPTSAIGYAVPIFTNRAEIERFCPLFLSQMSFGGVLDQGTSMRINSYGQEVQIAPFVWPATHWTKEDKADCKTLADRYDTSGARIFLKRAQQTIAAHGGRDVDTLQSGPFILTARRVSGSMVLYDLSRAPDGDYPTWLTRAIEQMSNPAATQTLYVTPNWHDQARYFVFGAIPSFNGILDALMPGFKGAHAKG